MDDYNRRYGAALAELEKAGIRGVKANPLSNRLLRRLGLKPRPPNYQTFLRVWLTQGLSFGLPWGLIMWIWVWRQDGQSIATSVTLAALAGTLFGLGFAVINSNRHKRHRLSRWTDL